MMDIFQRAFHIIPTLFQRHGWKIHQQKFTFVILGILMIHSRTLCYPRGKDRASRDNLLSPFTR